MRWSMAAPFLDDDPAFARGVRYGMLYMRLQRTRRDRVVDQVAEEDEERTRLMAHRIGWTVKRRHSAHGWITLTLVRARKGPDQLPEVRTCNASPFPAPGKLPSPSTAS